jgi:hypothetical protein
MQALGLVIYPFQEFPAQSGIFIGPAQQGLDGGFHGTDGAAHFVHDVGQ